MGVINNKTKEVMTAYELEMLSKNGEKNLVVMFSAGNEDTKKAMDILAMEGRSLENKVDFIFGGALNGKPNSNTFVDNVIQS